MAVMLLLLLAAARAADPVADNLTDTDEAEFRQGGIAQQLMASSYPAGLYGASASNAYQQYAAGAGAGAGGGYMNMIRNLYRPPSLGLTDKVKHWVKSFMNRRQYVKPYYGAPGLQFSADEFGAASGKPVLMSGGGYKAISIPLRQLQKYYKPYYGSEGAAQFLQSQQSPAAASSSILSYSPSGAGNGGGLYASETANAGHFAGGSSGLFGTGGSSSGLFGSGSSSGGLFGAGGSSGGLFSSGSDAALFAGAPASGLFAGSQGGIYTSGGGAGGNLFSPSGDGSSSALFSASGLQGMYGSSGASSGGLYLPNGGGSSSGGSSGFSLDGGSSGGLFSSDGGSSSYLGGSSGGDYGSRTAAASSLLTSLGGSGGASQYGDLYASGASPAASVYNPGSGGHQGRGYGGSSNNNKKPQQPSYGASSSALYVPSSSDSMRNPESYPMKSAQETPQLNSFNVDSSRNNQAEASYSVSFQPAQGKSYSAPYENAGFQPVAFGAEDGFKGKSS